MSQSQFGKNELVVFETGIYKVDEVIINQDATSYAISLVSYLENSLGRIDPNILKTVTAQENRLAKFEYGFPRYEIGSRLSDGSEVYLVLFTHDSHQYRYNLTRQNSILANLAEDDLTWRN